ncbi:Na+/H+ antiporter NhaA [Deinococcota bacterium DY0809b]
MRPIKRLVEQFLESEAKGGILLFTTALIAFLISNSPWAQAYFDLRDVYLKLQVGDWVLKKSLLHFVNDFLMAFFFLLVGLELKREILQGELKNPRQAGLAVAAALGGMVTPALIYTAFNLGGEGAAGWGVPMATDIAFALGVLSLLGKRVPLSLKVFLTALAIVDDLGAVLVIAVFYTSNLDTGALAVAALVFGVALLLGAMRVRSLPAYLLVGLVLWYFVLLSGVHATIAGVLLAFAVPIGRSRPLPAHDDDAAADPELQEARLEHLEDAAREAQSPLHRLEHLLHPYVAYFIMPVFAFFNAGVALEGAQVGAVAVGIFLGLLIGKPVGILLFSFLAVRLGLARLPEGVGWQAIAGVGLVAGIGFTMALFIAGLAFGPVQLDEAKLAILSASVTAALLGVAVLWRTGPAASRSA